MDMPDIWPAPDQPMKVARELLRRGTTGNLRWWRGEWWRHTDGCWSPTSDIQMNAWAYAHLEDAFYEPLPHMYVAWSPNKAKIGTVLHALSALVHLPDTLEPLAWLDGRDDHVLACRNGLLRLADRELLPHTPMYWNLTATPWDYLPTAPAPARWLRFLRELWPDDPDAIKALQQWFGYVLSGRTDLHKILLMIGPPRSGKGTIGRVLTALVGKTNVAGPTLSSLGTNFGLSSVIGKPLALVSDARFNRTGGDVVERLFTISGEDTITVDRKYKDHWVGRLSARFMILSNELPMLGDPSGAIASRFLILTLSTSFLGQEDTGLTDALLGELPGILLWSLEGLTSLEDSFVQPASSDDAMAQVRELASPVSVFVDEWCTLGPLEESTKDAVWGAWQTWCDANGHRPGTKQQLSRALRAAVPGLGEARPWENKKEGKRAPRQWQGISVRGPLVPTGPVETIGDHTGPLVPEMSGVTGEC